MRGKVGMDFASLSGCAALIVELFGLMCREQVLSSRPNAVVQLHSVDSPEYEAAALIANS